MMHTTLEHYLKEKKASVSSWQHSHEIHTLLANTSPSEQELSEFHWSSQAGGLSSCRQLGKGEKLSGDKDPEHRLNRLERKDIWLSKLRAFVLLFIFNCSIKLLPDMGRIQGRGKFQILDLASYLQEQMGKH